VMEHPSRCYAGIRYKNCLRHNCRCSVLVIIALLSFSLKSPLSVWKLPYAVFGAL